MPALLVVAAIVGVEVFEWARARLHDAPLVRVAGAILAIVVVLWPAVFAVREAKNALTDYKAAARTWIEQNVPAQSKIVLDGYSPWVDPTQYNVKGSQLVLRDLDAARASNPDAIVVTQAGSGRFLNGYDRDPVVVDNLNSLKSTACEQASFNRGESRIWVFRLHC